MTVLTILALLSQLAEPLPVDPEAGFAAVLIFDEPQRAHIGSGVYPVFPGVPTRFVPGEPPRPALTFFIPVPPGSEPQLEYSVAGRRPTGTGSSSVRTPALRGRGLDTREVAAEPESPPGQHAVLEGVIPLAGTSVAMVTVYPVVDETAAEYASRVRVNLTWEPVRGGIPAESNPLLALLAPRGSLYWREDSDQSYESVFWGLPWARISIGTTGGYEITGDQLENAGCQVTGSPCAALGMFTGPGRMFSDSPEDFHQLHEVAITVTDRNNDGIFDGEDAVRFFGRGLSRWETDGEGLIYRIQHRYATHNVYWLTWGGENGLRMSGLAGDPDASPDWGPTVRSDIWLREENLWLPRYETRTGWVWQTVSQGGSITVPFEVGGQGNCTVRVALTTPSSQMHTVTLYIDGDEVLEDTWYGSGERILEAAGLPLSGPAVLEIELTEESGDDEMSLSSVHVEYPGSPGELTGTPLFPFREKTGRYVFSVPGASSSCRAYDLTDHYRPLRVTGGEHTGGTYEFSFQVDTSTVLALMEDQDWKAPDSLSFASPGRLVGTVTLGDRLLVVPSFLHEGVWGMETLLSLDEFTPVVATTREIYDEFGQGVMDPGAIRSAVRWAMDSWSPGLSGLILVGDGHYDPLGFSTTQPVMIPPWIKLGTSRIDSVDDMYVMVHEEAVLPEIPVSRIPVDNLSQLGTCTAKLTGYAQGVGRGEWANRALVIADDEWGKSGSNNETEHTVNSELVAEEAVPGWMSMDKFFLIEYPWPPGTWPPDGPHPQKPEAREDFLEILDRGSAFMVYQGHGSRNQIAHEVLMLDQDVSGLNNGRRLPVSLWGTCDVGWFDNPGADAIGETVVLHPAGGSISSVAATRGTYGSSNYQFFRSIIDSLCTHPGLSVGNAVWQSKLAFSGSYSSNNRFYVMFGYPDMPLPLPDAGGTVTVHGDTLRSGELNTISGQGFQDGGLTFIEVLESSWNTVYTCLGGAQISYLEQGGAAYSGTQTVEGGEFTIDCFIPLQSTPGDLARAAACALSGEVTVSGARDPAVMIEGEPSGDDTQGPDVKMWIRGYEGVDYPHLTGDITLEAELTDSSGICILGGAGRELSLFVDGSGSDVSPFFSYYRGSAVSGRLVYDIESLTEGEHTLILWSFDGIGNSSRDTLELRILQDRDLSITQSLVYPNPGSGARCFSFRVSEDARVTVSIYTVAGTRINEISATCTQGYNQVLWNGLDHDGDPLASGPYIYKIRADALGSSVFSRTAEEHGVVAVTGEE